MNASVSDEIVQTSLRERIIRSLTGGLVWFWLLLVVLVSASIGFAIGGAALAIFVIVAHLIAVPLGVWVGRRVK